MDRQLFEQMYQGQAPWDIGQAQPGSSNWPRRARFAAVFSTWVRHRRKRLVLGSQGPRELGTRFRARCDERAKAKAASVESTPISSSATPWSCPSSAANSTP